MKRIEAFFDGSCKNNPSQIGSWGFVICDPWIEENGVIFGDWVTNNIAEYTALKKLLEKLEMLELDHVHVRGDSRLVCNIVNRKWGNKGGNWNPHRKYPELKKLAISCSELMNNHILSWVSRDHNQIADQLADDAYYI